MYCIITFLAAACFAPFFNAALAVFACAFTPPFFIAAWSTSATVAAAARAPATSIEGTRFVKINKFFVSCPFIKILRNSNISFLSYFSTLIFRPLFSIGRCIRSFKSKCLAQPPAHTITFSHSGLGFFWACV